jgi:16S rRNA (uracil1498-N3)-methyltransferase
MFDSTIHHLFYEPHMLAHGITMLNEEESMHIMKVLRKKVGDRLHTTDGRGMVYEVEIADMQKKNIALTTIAVKQAEPNPTPAIHIAIAPLKQIDRFEWFLEKAVEIGVTSIIPISTKRTERTVLKHERLQKIMLSAMKQSQRFHLPHLAVMTPFEQYLAQVAQQQSKKYIGWCGAEVPPALPQVMSTDPPSLQKHFLIGPEGDFTLDEANKAISAGFEPVSLGSHRLRTETAGIAALCLLQQY